MQKQVPPPTSEPQGRPSRGRFTERFFSQEKLDFEQIVLRVIENILASAGAVESPGNASQANALFSSYVIDLDLFVNAVLSTMDSPSISKYQKERKKLIDEYRMALEADPTSTHSAILQELFWVTINIIASERVIRIRKVTNFAHGWKLSLKAEEEQEKALGQMDAAEQEEESTESEGLQTTEQSE